MDFFLTDYVVHINTPYLCGLTKNGETVAVQVVHTPWSIYIEPPLNAQDEECSRSWYNTRVRPFLEKADRVSKFFRPSLQLVHQQRLCGYSPTKTWFIKATYDTLADAKRDAYAILRMFKTSKVYHHNIDPSLLLAAHTGIRCFSWLTLSSFQEVTTSRKSNCDLEIRCNARCISMDKDEDKPAPPLRVAAFDIETDGLLWKTDELRMISVVCENRDFLLTRHPISTDPVPDYCVIDCSGEADLIRKFVDVIRELKIIFLAGWNNFGFDLPFVFERAKLLGCDAYLRNLSWFPTRELNAVMKEMSSAAYGQNRIFHDDLVGLIALDGLILARKSMKVDSYKLSAFADWVGASKGDCTYEDMVRAFSTKDPALLREVADYCVQDSRLVPKILDRMEEPEKIVAMTRLASVPPAYTTKRGTSILTFGLIVFEAFRRSLIINPTPRVEGQEVGYKGATVIEPIRGLHSDPIAVLDFESLYPSIMRAFNICVSTFIKIYDPTEEVPSEYTFPDYSVIKIDGGFTAVFKRGVEGVFPSILRVLLDHRKAVKNQMKSLEPGTAYNQANAKQLSLKIASNSMYG
jgi:DNA polymerase delta subunit 1